MTTTTVSTPAPWFPSKKLFMLGFCPDRCQASRRSKNLVTIQPAGADLVYMYVTSKNCQKVQVNGRLWAPLKREMHYVSR